MKLYLDHLRFARLALVFCIFPFVRGCDDATGLYETTGFPVPFAVHTNNHYRFDDIDVSALAGDVILLVIIAALVARFAPVFYRCIGDLRVLAVVGVCAVIAYCFNYILFVLIFAVAMMVDAVVDVFSLGFYVIDFLSRMGLVLIVALSARILRDIFQVQGRSPSP